MTSLDFKCIGQIVFAIITVSTLRRNTAFGQQEEKK